MAFIPYGYYSYNVTWYASRQRFVAHLKYHEINKILYFFQPQDFYINFPLCSIHIPY